MATISGMTREDGDEQILREREPHNWIQNLHFDNRSSTHSLTNLFPKYLLKCAAFPPHTVSASRGDSSFLITLPRLQL